MRLFTHKSIIALATIGLLGMMAALVWLSGTDVINAQTLQPFIVEGKVMVDGGAAPDGSLIVAYINGKDVAEAKINGGTFVMAIPEQPGQYARMIFTTASQQVPDSLQRAGFLRTSLRLSAQPVSRDPCSPSAIIRLSRLAGNITRTPSTIRLAENLSTTFLTLRRHSFGTWEKSADQRSSSVR